MALGARIVRSALAARRSPLARRLELLARRLPPVDALARRSYARYRARSLQAACTDDAIRRAMLGETPLPAGYGRGMEERVVEYPWVLARLPDPADPILDAGSTLNFPWLIGLPALARRRIVIYTLAPEGVVPSERVSYLYGDLRDTVLRDAAFDAVVCISTLEHIGMDNARYARGETARGGGGWEPALAEIRRVLRPGGTLLLTVPFGRAADLGWLRVFDSAGLDRIATAFDGAVHGRDVFRHRPDRGWARVVEADAADAGFGGIGVVGGVAVGTMAEAVGCLHLVRP